MYLVYLVIFGILQFSHLNAERSRLLVNQQYTSSRSDSVSCEFSLRKLMIGTGGADCDRLYTTTKSEQYIRKSEDYTLSCTLRPCKPGYQYQFTPQTSYNCSSQTRAFVDEPPPKCKAICKTPCQNGGTCVRPETCLCPLKTYAGPQCQYPVAGCDPKKHFELRHPVRGGYNCNWNQTTLTCRINSCPDGYQHQREPADEYTCDFGEARFKPTYVPKCVAKACSVQCLNGGACITGDRCSCPSGYTGRRCETRAICSLHCYNGGMCIPEKFAKDRCDCAKGFTGTQCQYEKKSRCNARAVMEGTGGATCFYDQNLYSCTLKPCPSGYKYHVEPTAAYECLYSDGVFRDSLHNSTYIPKCEREDLCNPIKLRTNAGYKCHTEGDVVSCSLKTCPEGTKFASQPADVYNCNLKIGRFTPANTPLCAEYHPQPFQTEFNGTYEPLPTPVRKDQQNPLPSQNQVSQQPSGLPGQGSHLEELGWYNIDSAPFPSVDIHIPPTCYKVEKLSVGYKTMEGVRRQILSICCYISHSYCKWSHQIILK